MSIGGGSSKQNVQQNSDVGHWKHSVAANAAYNVITS